MHRVIAGHIFEIANKRTGYICVSIFLRKNNYLLEARKEQAEDLTTKIAEGKLNVKQIAKWLKKHSRKLSEQ